MEIFKFWVKCFNGTIVNNLFIVGPASLYCQIKPMCNGWELALYFFFFLFFKQLLFFNRTPPLYALFEFYTWDMHLRYETKQIFSRVSEKLKLEIRVMTIEFELWKLSYEWYSKPNTHQFELHVNFKDENNIMLKQPLQCMQNTFHHTIK